MATACRLLCAVLCLTLALILNTSSSNASGPLIHPKTTKVIVRLNQFVPIVGGKDESEMNQNLAPALAAQLETLFTQKFLKPMKFSGSQGDWETAMANEFQNQIAFVTFSVKIIEIDKSRNIVVTFFKVRRCISNTNCKIKYARPAEVDEWIWVDADFISSATPMISGELAKFIAKHNSRRISNAIN